MEGLMADGSFAANRPLRAYAFSDERIDVHIGRRLRNRRKILGLTQIQVAQACNVRFQQIQKYESGINKMSAARLWSAAQALMVPITYFFDGLPASPHAP
jgi:transcriptional regulator with XRE-family HTH domain